MNDDNLSLFCRCNSWSERLYLGVHLLGEVLCDLPATSFPCMADPLPQLQDDWRGLVSLADPDAADRHLPEAAGDASRRSQVYGGMAGPLVPAGIHTCTGPAAAGSATAAHARCLWEDRMDTV